LSCARIPGSPRCSRIRDGKRVTGVSYTNVLNGEEFEQPATIVLLCAYAINNVHLMLLSGIGAPYDPVAQKGVIGKNYCYQTGAAATLFSRANISTRS